MKLILCFLFFLAILPRRVSSDTQLVSSGPGIVRPGENLSLLCKVTGVSISSSSYVWNWVRQPPGKGLDWVARIYYDGRKWYNPSLQSRTTISSDTSKNQYSLQMNSLTTADSAMYFCAREALTGVLFDYWGKGTMVTVSSVSPSAPSLFPLILPSERLPSNGRITIGCLAKDVVPPVDSFTWDDLNNVSINANYIKQFPSVFNPNGTFTLSSQVSVSVNDWRNFEPFFCKANNTVGTTLARVTRQTSCLKPELNIHAPRLEDFENPDGNATLVCIAVNLHTPSTTVQWRKNGHVLDSGFTTTGPVAVGPSGYSIVSELTVDKRDWMTGKPYSCEVHNEEFSDIKNISKPLTCDSGPCSDAQVHVETIPPSFTDIYLTKSAKLTCRISNIPYDQDLKVLDVIWTRKSDNKELKTTKGEKQEQENNELVFVDATASVCVEEWDSGETFECKVTLPLLPAAEKKTLTKPKGGTPRAPEVYVFPPPSEQLKLQETATLTCLLKGFYPSDFFVTWLRNEEPVGDSEYITSHPIQESKTPERYFTYSTLNVKEQDWSYGATYTCVVGHEALPLQTIQKTIDKHTGKPTLVNVSLVLSDTTTSCY